MTRRVSLSSRARARVSVSRAGNRLRVLPAGLGLACVLVMLMGVGVGSGGVGVAWASGAQMPWWGLSVSSAPAFLRPGDGEDVLYVSASDLGDAPTSGPVTITDSLPLGMTAKRVQLIAEHEKLACEPLPVLSCTYPRSVLPYERIEMAIFIEVAPSLSLGQVEDAARIQGGGAAEVSHEQFLTVSSEPTPFGVQSLAVVPEGEEGLADTRAGSHPFQLTTTLQFNQALTRVGEPEPQAPALLKDVHFTLPAGLIGDPLASERCSNVDFSTLLLGDTNLCPAGSAVGAALVTLQEPANVRYETLTVPLFNLVPAPGEPARFGFEALQVPVILDTKVLTGGDYSVQVSINNATSAAQVLASQIVFWGEPGDPRHDPARGWACILDGGEEPNGGACEPPNPRSTTPLLRLPTSCESPLTASLTGDSWSDTTLQSETSIPALEGCGELPFEPSLSQAAPETPTASTPTGLDVSVHAPQTGLLQEKGLASADIRDTTVTLPQGLELNPSAANGLQACSEAQIGYTGHNAASEIQEFTPDPVTCPQASKLGLVHIKTPLLEHELNGAVYLAAPAPSGKRAVTRSTASSPCTSSLKNRSPRCWSSSPAKSRSTKPHCKQPRRSRTRRRSPSKNCAWNCSADPEDR